MIDSEKSFNESMLLANKFGMEDHPLFKMLQVFIINDRLTKTNLTGSKANEIHLAFL